ncbi:MAG: GuaB3 family IMP dehydrogenase-related protein [Dehalococcoidia bacterium]|jgi:IMP dehydrogenase|nr:GuaB3 family IMP dehydrogenase-related protein [Chloroflexota bacterium]MCK4243032.1 GuaB3 family IMP dehydrogenase-related protein [Dehalococcoidia bacterium]
MATPQFKEMRRCYSFDEVALVPGDVTINPEQVNIDFSLGNLTFSMPILASAMDAVVDPPFAVLMSKLGGLAVLNLEGVNTRYQDASGVLAEIANAPDDEVTPLLQKVYSEPIKENLIGDRIREIKSQGAVCAVSVTPQNTKRFAPTTVEAGIDILVVQSTVTSARHISKSYRGLVFSELQKVMPIPIIVGNCVSYSAALNLMREGVSGILLGVGPGAACTTREVLGVGVPQVTATMDCAAAREQYLRESGRYVAVITDGGIINSGDLCKAFASGADAVMLGSILAQAKEAPGQGSHWGMANPHPALPRGTRITVGTSSTLEQILFGPASVTGGTENLIGALRTAMGMCGALTIKEMQRVEMVIAPAMKTEGKYFQALQGYR